MKKLISIMLLAAVMLLTACGSNPAEASAYKFMELLKTQEFYEMTLISDLELDYLINNYSGIFVEEYTFKSISGKTEVKHIEKLYNHNTDSFEGMKRVYSDQYPDYNVIIDTDSEYIIESPVANISQYEVTFNVKYSDVAGVSKNTIVTLVVTQDTPKHDDDFVISEMKGIYNPYAVD